MDGGWDGGWDGVVGGDLGVEGFFMSVDIETRGKAGGLQQSKGRPPKPHPPNRPTPIQTRAHMSAWGAKDTAGLISALMMSSTSAEISEYSGSGEAR